MDQNPENDNLNLSPNSEEVKESFKSFIWETFKIIVISLMIIIPIRYFVIQPFYVKGASMEPNFYNAEYLIVDEISYRFSEPQRGDIIVFHYPKSPTDLFIKRIIGLPGERIEIKNNSVKIYNSDDPDGFILDETIYLPANTPIPNETNVELGQDQYFVMGDNRASSLDSRIFGPISSEHIIGKTLLRGWPISRAKVFKSVEY
jgi:signal peptidase I